MSGSSKFLLATGLALLGCAGAPPPEPPPPDSRSGEAEVSSLPSIDGHAVYPRPVDEASEAVQSLFAEYAATAVELPPPSETSMAAVQAWIGSTLTPFIRSQAERMQALEAAARPFGDAPAPEDRLLAALLVAYANAHFADLLEAVPTPDELAGDAELRAMFRRSLDDAAAPLSARARDAFAHCARVAPEVDSPPLAGWAERCASLAESRDARAQAAPPRPTSSRPPRPDIAWPSECRSRQRHAPAPDAPPPDRSAPPMLAVRLGESTGLPARAEARVLEAVSARAAEISDLALIPRAEITQAERLHGERRLRARGPRCGQAPPVSWILSQRHPHIVLGTVQRHCAFETDDCTLTLGFSRAGARSDSEGLPPTLRAPLAREATPAEWLAAAASLAHVPTGSVGILRAVASPITVRVVTDESIDPWLRVPSLLDEARTRLERCGPGAELEALSVDITLRISATGNPLGIEVRPRTGSEASTVRCIEEVLAELRWPCTPSASEQTVDLTLCLGRSPPLPGLEGTAVPSGGLSGPPG